MKKNLFDFYIKSILKAKIENSLCVGYEDGNICYFEIGEKELKWKIKAHKTNITSLNSSNDKNLIVCGSRDAKISVFNISEQTGLFKLSGHTAMITQTRFYKNDLYFISSSIDGLMKIWSTVSGSCLQTIPTSGENVWDFDFIFDFEYIALGGANEMIRVMKLDFEGEKEKFEINQVANFRKTTKKKVTTLRAISEGIIGIIVFLNIKILIKGSFIILKANNWR